MKKASPSQYAEALWQVCQGKSEAEIENIVARFVSMLKDHQQLTKGKAIIKCVCALYDNYMGRQTVDVLTGRRYSEAYINEIARELGERLEVKVEIAPRVDPAAIGGVLIRWKDMQIDSTIRTQLQKIRQTFNE